LVLDGGLYSVLGTFLDRVLGDPAVFFGGDVFLDVIKEVILGGDFDLFVLAVDGDCFFEEGMSVSIYMLFFKLFLIKYVIF
jgi:hypothetical protein